MIIFVDVDDVCADLMPAWFSRYNADYDDALKPEDIKAWAIDKFVKPECGKKIFRYLDDGSIYKDVRPIDGALEGIKYLRDLGHRVVFASSGIRQASAKYSWLVEHEFLEPSYKHEDYIGGYDKSLLRGDILIDDGPHNIESFSGVGILMRRPHNEHFSWSPSVLNWDTAVEVVRCIQQGRALAKEESLHITEVTRPHQVKAFREVIEKMYQVHLDKNADYSPANILGTGEIGLMTRTWDKIARLMNLMGFKIEIASMRYETPATPKNESIDDSIQDLAVYAIIWQLYRKGVWGK